MPVMTVLDAIKWCRLHNASIRFESDGTVTVRMNGTSRRRATLVDTVEAQAQALAARVARADRA